MTLLLLQKGGGADSNSQPHVATPLGVTHLRDRIQAASFFRKILLSVLH